MLCFVIYNRPMTEGKTHIKHGDPKRRITSGETRFFLSYIKINICHTTNVVQPIGLGRKSFGFILK